MVLRLDLALGAAALGLWFAAAGCSGETDAGTGTSGGGGAVTGAGGGATSSTTAASTGPTTSSATTSAATTTASSTTVTTGTGDPPCFDTGPGEPNETEDTAYQLAPIGDGDGDEGNVAGILKGDADVDWYVYEGSDNAGATVDPTRELKNITGGRICAFFECLNGGDSFTCPAGTTEETSPAGRAGCCGEAPFSVDDLNCSGISDDANVYLRVDAPGGSECKEYTLTYHY